MVNILFINDDKLLSTPGTVRKLLDPACGTGGMLAEAQNYLRDHHEAAKLYVFGQDYNKRAYATAASDAGKLYCWGNNGNGELGLGNTTQYKTPQQVGADTTWTAISQISFTQNMTCGIDAGKLYCWGYGAYGQLGLGNTSEYHTPQQVGSDTTWTAVSANGYDSCGVDGGKLYCWGINQSGEDGLGNTTSYNTPQQVGSATTWTAVSGPQTVESYPYASPSSYDTCGLKGGVLYCWGKNAYGEDGDGTTTENDSPVLVAPLY
jgi:alpha-tubulin suppressor-like RCC1 family protein